MKAFLELKEQPLPNYEAKGLWQTIIKSAREHGYRSFVWYAIIRLKDHYLNIWSRTTPWNGMRIKLQRWRGVTIGQKVHWGTDVTVDPPFPYFLVVEDGVSLAGNNIILTHNKPLKYHSKCSPSYVAPVVIRKNAWVACGVMIMPGVEIGEGAIVTAGSIVSKNIPPLVMASGNPAKMVADMSALLKDNYTQDEFDRIIAERKKKYKKLFKDEA